MFHINEFRFMTLSDHYMVEFSNWSRPYEYAFILDKIKAIGKENLSIHNTCCGYAEIHVQFAEGLNQLSTNVTHSDIHLDIRPFFKAKNIKTEYYDIETPNTKSFDVVVCVSSLEDVYYKYSDYDKLKSTFDNLLNQINHGGRLLITCDYPCVPLECCERLMGQKIVDDGVRLDPPKSVMPDPNFQCNIIAMDLTKE